MAAPVATTCLRDGGRIGAPWGAFIRQRRKATDLSLTGPRRLAAARRGLAASRPSVPDRITRKTIRYRCARAACEAPTERREARGHYRAAKPRGLYRRRA